jgi:hypothetical protein
MRRIKLFAGCILLIVLALPLLPGPGCLIIAEAIAALEREFAWVRRIMDRLGHTAVDAPRADARAAAPASMCAVGK